MIPADLLDKLREKDPELWGKLQDQLKKLRAYQEGRVYEVDVIATFECLPQISGWILQGLLQDAIRARGYGYGMEYYHGPRMVGVSIYKWGNVFEKITIGAGYRTTGAEALLLAYLAAIQAEDKEAKRE
jgi:hypothetical protein